MIIKLWRYLQGFFRYLQGFFRPAMPLPCKMLYDRKGNKFNSVHSWFCKLNEEVREARRAFYDRDGVLADELADIITVCVSMLEYIGVDETERGRLFERINSKNRKRGYHITGADCRETESGNEA